MNAYRRENILFAWESDVCLDGELAMHNCHCATGCSDDRAFVFPLYKRCTSSCTKPSGVSPLITDLIANIPAHTAEYGAVKLKSTGNASAASSDSVETELAPCTDAVAAITEWVKETGERPRGRPPSNRASTGGGGLDRGRVGRPAGGSGGGGTNLNHGSGGGGTGSHGNGGGMGQSGGPNLQREADGGHRASCHRCGNLRKRNVKCSSCPHIYCQRCAEKMVLEFGEKIFDGGCPVCKGICCCNDPRDASYCERLFHCYKKVCTPLVSHNSQLTSNITNQCCSAQRPRIPVRRAVAR
jgi:hypothetical protein